MADAKKRTAKKTADKKVEAPEPVEPKAVEVSPEETPTANFHGEEYTLTPEEGYRKKK